jgi:hypothetical protein
MEPLRRNLPIASPKMFICRALFPSPVYPVSSEVVATVTNGAMSLSLAKPQKQCREFSALPQLCFIVAFLNC